MTATRSLSDRLRALLRGLPPGADVPSPLCPDDRYRVLLALYGVISRRMGEGRVLDLGCGAGGGAALLAETPGRFVLGVETDRRWARFARRHFRRERLDFVALPDALPSLSDLGERPFDFVVARQRVRQGHRPEASIAALAALLAPAGRLFAAVAPIGLPEGLVQARAADPGGTHLFAWYWEALFASAFEEVELVRVLPPPGRYPDFASREASSLVPEDFVADTIEAEDLRRGPALDLLVVASRPRTVATE